MNRLKLVIGLLALGVGIQMACAQEEAPGDLRAHIEATRASIKTDRLLVVSEHLPLTAQEADQFWPLYNEYQNEVDKQIDRWIELVTVYGQNYGALSDDTALKLMRESLSVEQDSLRLKVQYAERAARVLPGVKAYRWLQIENRLDTMIRDLVMRQIPLAQ
jgi:hypothetical protein